MSLSIKVDQFLTVQLDIPQEMTALQFLGLLEKVRRLLPKSVIEELHPVALQGSKKPRVKWTDEMVTLLKDRRKKKVPVREIYEELVKDHPMMTIEKVAAMAYKL